MSQTNLEICFEDDFCLIVNKPSDLLTHHSHYARNIFEKSLTEIVRELFPNASPVHRLDRKTSGLILFAKQKEFVSAFQSLFDDNKIQKKYFAVVRGWLDEDGIIDSPIKNERGNYQEAETHYRIITKFEKQFQIGAFSCARYSLVEFIPKTGRTHQLRKHAAKIAHPIINDPKYGDRHHNHYFEEKLNLTHLFLHSFALKFIHPFNNQTLNIQKDFPLFWIEQGFFIAL